VEIPKEDAGVIRRGLMVVAKIIQNLANNIFFGKELHMVVLNSFLEDNIVNVTRFLGEVNVCSSTMARVYGRAYLVRRNIPLVAQTKMKTSGLVRVQTRRIRSSSTVS
jgi:hypothetical protein